MKFYIGGKWYDKKAIQSVMQQVRQAGHTITHDWTTYEAKYTDKAQKMTVCSAKDIEGVRNCDIFVALMTDPEYPYRGTFTELGAAIALGKMVYVIGPKTTAAASNCFWWHPRIVHGDAKIELGAKLVIRAPASRE